MRWVVTVRKDNALSTIFWETEGELPTEDEIYDLCDENVIIIMMQRITE